MIDEEDLTLPVRHSRSSNHGRSSRASSSHISRQRASDAPRVTPGSHPYSRPVEVALNHPSNLVYRHQHPLHTGLSDRLYNRFDRVRPVVDVMMLLDDMRHSNTYVTALRREAQRRTRTEQRVAAPIPAPAPAPARLQLQDHPDPQGYFEGRVDHLGRTEKEQQEAAKMEVVCAMCGTPQSREMTADKDSYVCACGNVLGQNVISNHRDKACDESEDKTIRADAVHEQGNTCFDQPAPSAEESRRQRMREQNNVVISRKQAKKMGIGYVHQQINRQAAVEARAGGFKTESNPQGWSQTERSKADTLMRELEKLIRAHGPMSKSVQSYLRMMTTNLWERVVTHERICCGSVVCKKKVSGRTVKSIAEAAFDYHVDQLLMGGAAEEHRIAHEEVRTLKERWSCNRRALNAHMVSTRAMVSLIMEQDVRTPCVESEASSSNQTPGSSRPESPSLVHSPDRVAGSSACEHKLPRNDSLVPSSPDEVPRAKAPSPALGQLSPLLVFRQSILRVHKLFQSMLPLTVKEKAMELLADGVFTSALYGSDASPQDAEGKSAYALLMALEAVRPKNGKERIHDTSFICKLVGLQDDEAQSLTGCIKSLLPGTIWTAPSHSSEEFDGLF